MTEETTAEVADRLRIDIVSDVVCPWCIIGYKQLEQALKNHGQDVDLHWHPFELNPHMVAEGENLRDHIVAKYGTKPEESEKAREKMTALGADLGFTFNYHPDMRMVNTFRAHQLIHWADVTAGRGHDMKMQLFGAFFSERKNLHDIDVLVEEAKALDLDGDEARAVLTEQRYEEAVRKHEVFWITKGIQGVPAVIFNQKYLLSGAQGVENYGRFLTELKKEMASDAGVVS